MARTKGYNLFLTATGATISLSADDADKPDAAIRMTLLGADPEAPVIGQSPLPGKVNYLSGTDPGRHLRGISTFERVKYAQVYPGVDLAYYGKSGHLEYDFLVAPGADTTPIRFGVEGAERLHLDASGDLIISTAAGVLTQRRPVVYQYVDGGRRSVEGSFMLDNDQIGFALGAYDRSLPLVIDPVLAFSSYLGGSAFDQVGGRNSLAVDDNGNSYIVGITSSADFPTTTGALRNTLRTDAAFCGGVCSTLFVAKLNRTATALVYSTFLATNLNDPGSGIALVPDGSVWVTSSARGIFDVPVTPGAFLPTVTDAAAYLVHLSADGSQVLYGTYLANPDGAGTYRTDWGAIALDPSGDVWVAPNTANVRLDNAPPFPTTAGAVQSACAPTPGSRGRVFCQDFLVIRIHPGGAGRGDLAYASWLGGTNNTETALALKVQPGGNVTVFGKTNSTDFPTTPGALQPVKGDAGNTDDAFVVRIRPAGNGPSDLLYSTYFGAGGNDTLLGSGDMALGPDGTVYVTFGTDSFGLRTTPGAYSPFQSGRADTVVARINPAGAGVADLLYSTYVGSTGDDYGNGIAVDGRGHAYVTGAGGTFFPVRDPLACCAFSHGPADSVSDRGDAVLFELNPAGQGDADLIFSTFLGGTNFDEGRDVALAVDSAGRGRLAWVNGNTRSNDLPVTPGVFQATLRSDWDAFVSKIDFTDQFPCTRTLSGNVASGVVATAGEIVCVNNASVTTGITVQPGGEVRIRDSRIAGSVTANQATAFTMCGTLVSGSVGVGGTAPVLVTTTGAGCPENTVLGTSNVPGGTGPTPSTTTTSTAPTTTTSTIQQTTSTLQPTTSTTGAPVTSTTLSPSTSTICAALAQQLLLITDPAARQRIQAYRASLGCPA